MSSQSLAWSKPNTWREPSADEYAMIVDMLGKKPRGQFSIAARNKDGVPTVIENAPFFDDGTPMPTRYWLVDLELGADVARIESAGGVKLAQEEISPDDIKQVHVRYQTERDALIADGYDGPRPSAGVGGTRKGVKCLHAHVANFLATGDDVVGEWTLNKIVILREAKDLA